jgi:preprotein translocase subunit SecF
MTDLMGKKYYFFGLSLAILLTGLVFYFINGLQLDIQFQGGTIMKIQMPDDKFDTDKAAEIVKSSIGKTATVQKSSTYNAEDKANKIHMLVLNIASEDTLTDAERQKVLADIKKEFSVKDDAEINVSSIAPFIGDEIRKNGVLAVVWSSILIIIYVWFRFKALSGLSAGVMSIVALLHDVLIMFVIYIVFRIPLNDSFIAAILTVIGYSMNDTVIIYDRIRENKALLKKTPIAELVNKSIMQTLNRSINTGIAALRCINTDYVVASLNNIKAIQEFSFPLIIGIASGCYSSIFIASPLYVLWIESKNKKRMAVKASKA